MGLGKTIQTLTRIVEGQPSAEDRNEGTFAKTTLYVGVYCVVSCLHVLFNGFVTVFRIVTPVSVLPQWASEIEKMTIGLKVIKHHGPDRTTSEATPLPFHCVYVHQNR